MQTLWLNEKLHYDGSQLKPLFGYLNFGVLGDSVLSWRGSCDVSFEHMADGEDLIAESTIAGSDMVHFIVEVFDRELATGVLLQRIFAAIIKDLLVEMSRELEEHGVVRDGDDLYWGDRKLSISIASRSSVSTMVHFAVNISNQGTPVKTGSLEDLGVDIHEFATAAMDALALEWNSVLKATRKVKPL
jgi:hypothetical protein